MQIHLLVVEIKSVGEQQNFKVVDEVLFNREMTRLIWRSPEKTGSYEILRSMETIDVDAFYGCGKLILITIPDSITEISACTLSGCSGLEVITFHPQLLRLVIIPFLAVLH